MLRRSWHTYEHYIYALVAVTGTALETLILAWMVASPVWDAPLRDLKGLAPPFMNIVGVLFGLTIAFLSNDTWTAHDRARGTVLREADAIRGLDVLASTLPPANRAPLRAALATYAAESAAEWTTLSRGDAETAARAAADRLLSVAASPESAAAGPTVQGRMLTEIATIREARDTRIGLSRAHVNPLKWAAMAFLGFLTEVAIAAVHVASPGAAIWGMVIFGLAAAPTAAMVLVHANPFQPPSAVKPTLIAEALTGRRKLPVAPSKKDQAPNA